MAIPGRANAVTMAANTIRGMGVPSVVMRNGTTMGTWGISEPGVGAVMEFYSPQPPEVVAADFAKVFANPQISSVPGETHISGPYNSDVGKGTVRPRLLEGTVTFSVGPPDEPSSSVQTVIGAQYFLNTRPLADNTGIAELAAQRLEDFVFTVTVPLDERGHAMERPSVAAAGVEGRTQLDQDETLEMMFR
jgi:hypothetical protein